MDIVEMCIVTKIPLKRTRRKLKQTLKSNVYIHEKYRNTWHGLHDKGWIGGSWCQMVRSTQEKHEITAPKKSHQLGQAWRFLPLIVLQNVKTYESQICVWPEKQHIIHRYPAFFLSLHFLFQRHQRPRRYDLKTHFLFLSDLLSLPGFRGDSVWSHCFTIFLLCCVRR